MDNIKKKFQKWFSLAVVISGLLAIWSCEEKIIGDYNENIPPETYVFIQSTDTLNYTQSIQTIYCFPLKITGTDTIYLFQVKAVDNLDAEDPTPARQYFPIKNSPPQISWNQFSQIPDTTFTIASFTWDATDPDGESTISYFEYALDDTSTWRRISGQKRTLTLNADSGLTIGNHAFYIRAVDIAGARSPILRMPEDTSVYWYVKAPKGRYLLIDDYQVESSISAYPDAYYKNMLKNLLTNWGEDFSYWNIEKLFPASQAQFTETLKLFDRIVWYTDIITENDPHFIAAQVAIPEFRKKGGKIIYTVQFNTGFGGQGYPLDFSPVEALDQAYNFIPQNSIYKADSAFAITFPQLSPLPDLKLSKFVVGLISLIPKSTSVPMYRYEDPKKEVDPIFVMVGRNDNTGEYDFVFSGTPLHFLQANNNLDEFFRIVLEEIFTP